MASTDKIFRDPLYNYVRIEQPKHEYLVKLLDCPEVQRLRRIRQLGVSHFTYPGADHSRLSHCLGVLHLTQEAWNRIDAQGPHGAEIDEARRPLLAAALLHDVGHGPFSHLFEPCLGINHEEWSCRIIEEDTQVNKKLKKHRVSPEEVAALIRKGKSTALWEKSLLSSQLDVDRLDFLRRDSLFTGAGYGHFDWYRILHTFVLKRTPDGLPRFVWPDKAKYAIEEYIFARFYMYCNVYQHKTTRGFEKLVHAAWDRAKQLREEGKNPWFIKQVDDFLGADHPSVQQYLALDDAAILYQLQVWSGHPDKVLSDLTGRFLNRKGFKVIDAPEPTDLFADDWTPWETALRELVGKKGFSPPEFYVLRDEPKLTIYQTIYQPYRPEAKEEQDPFNAILIQQSDDEEPTEISTVLKRLKHVIEEPHEQVRYYVPKEAREDAKQLRGSWEW